MYIAYVLQSPYGSSQERNNTLRMIPFICILYYFYSDELGLNQHKLALKASVLPNTLPPVVIFFYNNDGEYNSFRLL